MAKILLIDDEPDLLFLYTKALEVEGFSTLTATTAGEGLAKAANDKPDLIILDLMMKPTDGFAVFKELKKNPLTTDIPVIILTNLTQHGLYDDMLNQGAEAFLEKTDYAPRDIAEKIRTILHLS
jgi:DNA-binding response OmpR family regulator